MWEEWHMFLQGFLMSGLTESSWIFILASAFNPLSYIIFIEVDKENSALNRYVGRKRIILWTSWEDLRDSQEPSNHTLRTTAQ